MRFPSEGFVYLATVQHQGTVALFGLDAERTIWYSVRLGEPANAFDPAETWSSWLRLPLPDQQVDRSVVDKERAGAATDLIGSCFSTRHNAALAPIQCLSDGDHIWVFRQSSVDPPTSERPNLLADRFVLDGEANELVPKLEVRFKRSGQKYQPRQDASGHAMDSRDFRDAHGRFFFEPTTELRMIDGLHDGQFAVVLCPTSEHDVFRWHIFAHNANTDRIEVTSLRRSPEAVFDVRDGLVREGQRDQPTVRRVPAFVKRSLDLQTSGGHELTSIGPLAATAFALQERLHAEDESGGDEGILIKTGRRVMLTVPVEDGIAAVSYAVDKDGSLTELEEPTEIVPEDEYRVDVMLPADLLAHVAPCRGVLVDPEIAQPRGHLVFDGSSSSVELDPVEVGGDFTVEAWVDPVASPERQTIIATDSGREPAYFELSVSSGVDATLGGKRLVGREISLAGWHHVAAVVSRETPTRSNLAIYVDGELVSNHDVDLEATAVTHQPLLLGRSSSASDWYRGGVADVRIWSTARTAEEIRATKDQRLLGRELHLEGYWPLDAMAGPTVPDFSPARQPGVVKGAALAGSTVPHAMRDGDRATSYRNDTLVPVAQGATYVESIEYRCDDDSEGFDFAFWGRSGGPTGPKTSETVVPASITNIDDGWKRGAARFTIPDGMTHLRAFEMRAPDGAWTEMRLRNHAIERVRNTLTRLGCSDTVTLAGPVVRYEQVQEQLIELSRLGATEADLLVTMRDKQHQLLPLVANGVEQSLEQRISDLEGQIQILEKTKGEQIPAEVDAKKRWDSEKANPFNYWCWLTTQHTGFARTLDVLNADARAGAMVIQYDKHGGDNQKWALETRAAGTYKIRARHSGKYLQPQWDVWGGVIWQQDRTDDPVQSWRFEPRDGCYAIRNVKTGEYLTVNPVFGFVSIPDSGNGAIVRPGQGGGLPTQHFRVEQVPGVPPAEQPNWAAISQAEEVHVEAAKNLEGHSRCP